MAGVVRWLKSGQAEVNHKFSPIRNQDDVADGTDNDDSEMEKVSRVTGLKHIEGIDSDSCSYQGFFADPNTKKKKAGL